MTDDGRPLTENEIPSGVVQRRSRRVRQIEPSPSAGSSLIRRPWLEWLARFFQIAGFVVLVIAFIFGIAGLNRPAQVIALAPAPIQTIIPTLIPLPSSTPTPKPSPTITPTPLPPLIALLAGHSGGADTGAICPDGLREVDITSDVAQRARTLLIARGYRVDILAEFDKRLDATKRDYAPQVFLAIHADSCVYYASGYKVARAENSAIPVEDDRLVRCVSSMYAAATQLAFHEGSITRDMTHYHGLNEIDSRSAAAIIELGFLGSDKDVLKNKRDTMALAIVNGIGLFLRGELCQ